MFGRKISVVSVDSILQDFVQKVEQLKGLVTQKREHIAYNEGQIVAINLSTQEHQAEVTRALRVQAKLEEIVG